MKSIANELSETPAGFVKSLGVLLPALLLIAVTTIICGIWLVFGGTRFGDNANLYLLPWIALTAAVICAPGGYLLYLGRLDLFQPLVFAAWSYFIPAFVVGGLILAFGITQPFFMHFIDDPEAQLPLTMVYVALGYLGLTTGFYVPYGRRLGAWIGRQMPRGDWESKRIVLPSLILIGVGIFFYFAAWLAGGIGYQLVDTTDSTGGINYFLSLLTLIAGFLLCLHLFRAKAFTINHLFVFVVVGWVLLSRVVLSGARGGLLQLVVLVAMAFVYSGRRLKWQQSLVFGGVVAIAIVVGMIYGTTFRSVKGSEERIGIGEYIEKIFVTADVVLEQPVEKTFGEAFENLSERIEVTSSLAVVVANYERLQPYEAAYGLENNIWTYTWTAFIPRFVWADKPIVSDARAYSDLYFNFAGNSFAITPMGDLLRNFGPLGVPLGMLALGILLRVMYAALIENQPLTFGRTMTYYMLLTAVSYESFYGTILPSLLRILFVCALGWIFISFVLQRERYNQV